MASLQTHVLVNNEWVTRTVTADQLIGKTSHSRTKSEAPRHLKPIQCGILTRTVIESPITRWVLPAQLRSFRFNDVALVGDRYVQISEPDADGQLQPVSRKVYTHSKIKNCQVIGIHDYLRKSKQDTIRRRTSDDASTASLKDVELFQQLLIVVLSDGSIEFLFLKETATGDWDFVSSKHSVTSGRLVNPGFHMTVSPDSQYMALGCSEDLFIVYQLESIENIRRQHNKGLLIRPVRSAQARAVRGVVHKLEFLHPGSLNASHVVLSVITVRRGILRLALYEWEDTERLSDALNKEMSGIRLDATLGMPLLIIPLIIRCQFLVITEHSVTICSDVLGGPPVFTNVPIANKDASEWHHGSHPPLWTAWARPQREQPYHAATDMIYLAREDGWINLLEINSYGIEASLYMGPLECNIDSEFAAVSTRFGDILMAGGSHGHGKIWVVEARRNPKPVGKLPNWAPTADITLANDVSRLSRRQHKKLSKWPSSVDRGADNINTPKRIFACSGRDRSGAIVELRYGIEAKIGLDLIYTSPIKRCWVVPNLDTATEEGFLLLLALPQSSAILHILQDLSEVSEKDQDQTMFDLLSTTLAVHVSGNTVIQVTSTQATIVSPHGCYQHRFDTIEDQLATVIDAAIADGTIALSVYSQNAFKLIVYRYDDTKLISNKTFDLEGEVTALSTATFSFGTYVLVGLSQRDSSSLVIFTVNWDELEGQPLASIQREPVKLTLRAGNDADSMVLNAVTSITTAGDDNIVVGMRNGDTLMIRPPDNHQPEHQFMVIRTNHCGMSPAYVFNGPALATGASCLVCTDKGVTIMMEQKLNPGFSEKIFQVWLTDANEPHLPSPTVDSVTGLHQVPGYDSFTWAMISGERILITEIQPCAGPVPRYLPVGGTPKAILYSERLDALVTVVAKKGIDSLHFIDPTTGTDISRPTRKLPSSDDEYKDIDYISSLGSPDVKVTALFNWRYEYDGKPYSWFVILAGLRDGQGLLLVISAENEKIKEGERQAVVENEETPRRICFYTINVKRFKEALRTGTTDEHGIFVNYKTTLEYYIIDDKKFKRAMIYELPSPATRLEVVDGQLHALTTHHSLLILDYKSVPVRESGRMVRLHTDEIARNGLSSITLPLSVHTAPTAPAKERQQQRIILVSDPMCTVSGLWPPGENAYTSSFQLLCEAELGVSIRKFVQGFTRPPWSLPGPQTNKQSVLGLAIDGSVTQFTILDEHVWRLLAFIQNRLLLGSDHTIYSSSDKDDDNDGHDDDDGGGGGDGDGRSDRYDSADGEFWKDPRLLPASATSYFPTTKGHVDGDVLQRCLENKQLEKVFTSPQHLAEIRGLLVPFGLEAVNGENSTTTTTRTAAAAADEDASKALNYAYHLLEYYLASAI